jgi:hypothetical protein
MTAHDRTRLNGRLLLQALTRWIYGAEAAPTDSGAKRAGKIPERAGKIPERAGKIPERAGKSRGDAIRGAA